MEVVVATLLVGLVLVGAMNTVGAALRGAADSNRRSRAALLAEDLMGEILQQYYSEPDDPVLFGTEGVEGSAASGPRALWDDVDDYSKWDASPPEEKDGTPIPDAAGWRRSVEVTHVAPDDLTGALSNMDDQGMKRIVVRVSHNGQQLASLLAIHTDAWIDMIPDPDNDQTTGSKPPVNQPPVAVASSDRTSGTQIVDVSFDATGSSDPDGDPLGYLWDFGDGATATGSKPTHTFTNYDAGTITRTVTLTATDSYGATDTDTLTITIHGI
jgi:hypothetical protein